MLQLIADVQWKTPSDGGLTTKPFSGIQPSFSVAGDLIISRVVCADGTSQMNYGEKYHVRVDLPYGEQYKDEIHAIANKNGQGEPWAQHSIGTMYCWAKDSLSAADYFRKAYEMDGERFWSLYMLIDCQLKSNMNIEECLRLSEIGLIKKPESRTFLWCKGLALHKMGRHEEALALLREVEDGMFGMIKKLQKDIREIERALALQKQ